MQKKLYHQLCMKSCSSLEKMISDVENNLIQNKQLVDEVYRNVLAKYKNAKMGSSAIYVLHGVHAISKLTIKTYFYMIYNT